MPKLGQKPLNIGHRGHAMTLENTLLSFHQAVDMGAEMLELDVRLSKDGVPKVIHDNGLKRISGKNGSVSTRTARFLGNLDLGPGLRIPGLSQVLQELIPRVPINIEMKFRNLDYRPLVAAVCNLVTELDCVKNVIVSSFFHQSLDVMRSLNPEIAVAPLFGTDTGIPHDYDLNKIGKRKYDKNELPFSAPTAVVYHRMIDQAMVDRFAERGLNLFTYTVDEPEEMRRLIALGIEGIITNRPDLLKIELADAGF